MTPNEFVEWAFAVAFVFCIYALLFAALLFGAVAAKSTWDEIRRGEE